MSRAQCGDSGCCPPLFAGGHDVVGVREGWRGLVDGIFQPLGPREVSGILPRGGTILGTTRTNPYKIDGGVERVLENFRGERLDALVAIGGEDTLGVAARLFAERQFPVVGVPKTIDNDLSGDRLHVRLRHGGHDRDRGASTACTRRPSRTTV